MSFWDKLKFLLDDDLIYEEPSFLTMTWVPGRTFSDIFSPNSDESGLLAKLLLNNFH